MEQTKKTIETEEAKEESPIERAENAAKSIEEQIKKLEEATKKYEDAYSRQLLAGKSMHTAQAPQMTEEQMKKEKTAEFWKGTEIEKAIRKHG